MDNTNSKKKTIRLIVCICILVALTEIIMFVYNVREISSGKNESSITSVSKI